MEYTILTSTQGAPMNIGVTHQIVNFRIPFVLNLPFVSHSFPHKLIGIKMKPLSIMQTGLMLIHVLVRRLLGHLGTLDQLLLQQGQICLPK